MRVDEALAWTTVEAHQCLYLDRDFPALLGVVVSNDVGRREDEVWLRRHALSL